MSATKLEDMPIGSVVKITVDGEAQNFIVAYVYTTSGTSSGKHHARLVLQNAWGSPCKWAAVADALTSFYSGFGSDMKSHMHKATLGDTSGYVFLPDKAAVSGGWPYFDSDEHRTCETEAHIYTKTDGTQETWWYGKNWWTSSEDSDNSGYRIYINYGGEVCSEKGDGVTTSEAKDMRAYIRPAICLDGELMVADDGTVTTSYNVAPTAPASITAPETIMSDTDFTVSWAEATDENGNLAGYKLERSVDGGSTWTQVYQGIAASATDKLTYGAATSAAYRVKAYDTYDLESAYVTISGSTVISNKAPTAPASISVPANVRGGHTLIISWDKSTDADGNLSGYRLYRTVNSDTTSLIYTGTACIYTDTITEGWEAVQYSVQAYDPYSQSEMTSSEERTVINNTAPTITCDYADGTDLGTKAAAFSVEYSVDDVNESDTLTVTETLDSATRRTFTATRGTAYSFALGDMEFMKLLNGSHTITISVTDGEETASRTFTFAKAVTAASVTLKTPLAVDGSITLAALQIMGSVPTDAELTVKVTNNANDDAPVWQDCTNEVKVGTNIVFENTAAANGFAFNFDVSVKEGSTGTAGSITAVIGAFE